VVVLVIVVVGHSRASVVTGRRSLTNPVAGEAGTGFMASVCRAKRPKTRTRFRTGNRVRHSTGKRSRIHCASSGSRRYERPPTLT
jgi:hypothetical protein